MESRIRKNILISEGQLFFLSKLKAEIKDFIILRSSLVLSANLLREKHVDSRDPLYIRQLDLSLVLIKIKRCSANKFLM